MCVDFTFTCNSLSNDKKLIKINNLLHGSCVIDEHIITMWEEGYVYMIYQYCTECITEIIFPVSSHCCIGGNALWELTLAPTFSNL